ncbi:MAG: carboxypeptidase-like regulatory domain-containing protein [Candidatus Hydrogenedentota bacterium]
MKSASLVYVVLAAGIIAASTIYWFMRPPPVAKPEGAPSPSPAKIISDVSDKDMSAPVIPTEKPEATEASQPDPPGLVIAGIVTTTTETPAAGARVAAYTADTGATRATADDDGRFRIVGLRPGAYRVSALLEHYNEAVLEGIQAGASDVSLVLEPLSAIEGRVLDGRVDQPLAKFNVVWLHPPPGDDTHWQNILRGETAQWMRINDPEGYYRIEDIRSDVKFAVAVSAEGFEPAYATVPPVQPGQTAHAPEIVLLPEAVLLGRVVCAQRQPIAGADIFLGTEARGRTLARSDPDGCFIIDRLSPGPITLTAAHSDYLSGTAEAMLSQGDETEVEIVLGSGGSIQGTVLDGTTPLSGQKIVALRLEPPRVRKESVTDEAGIYTIRGVDPGEIEVIAKLVPAARPDSRPVRLQKKVVVEKGRVTIVDFQLADAASAIEGLVTLRGKPVATAAIKGYVAGESGDVFFNASAAIDGTYFIDNLPAGDAWVQVVLTLEDGRERRKNVSVHIPVGQTVRLDTDFMASAGVYGTVDGLAPNERGEVMALMGPYDFNPAQIDIDELKQIEIARSPISPNGEYTLLGLEPGTYTIIAVAFDPHEAGRPALHTTTQNVTLEEGEERLLILNVS